MNALTDVVGDVCPDVLVSGDYELVTSEVEVETAHGGHRVSRDNL